MKVSVNDVELFTLSPIQLQVLADAIPVSQLENDLKRRLQWVLTHKYEQAFADLKKEWDRLLPLNGVDAVPTAPDAYASLVFSQPNYKDRETREQE